MCHFNHVIIWIRFFYIKWIKVNCLLLIQLNYFDLNVNMIYIILNDRGIAATSLIKWNYFKGLLTIVFYWELYSNWSKWIRNNINKVNEKHC
jgi:hypothetical protein